VLSPHLLTLARAFALCVAIGVGRQRARAAEPAAIPHAVDDEVERHARWAAAPERGRHQDAIAVPPRVRAARRSHFCSTSPRRTASPASSIGRCSSTTATWRRSRHHGPGRGGGEDGGAGADARRSAVPRTLARASTDQDVGWCPSCCRSAEPRPPSPPGVASLVALTAVAPTLRALTDAAAANCGELSTLSTDRRQEVLLKLVKLRRLALGPVARRGPPPPAGCGNKEAGRSWSWWSLVSGSLPEVAALRRHARRSGLTSENRYERGVTSPIVFPTTPSAELPPRITGALTIDVRASNAAGATLAEGDSSSRCAGAPDRVQCALTARARPARSTAARRTRRNTGRARPTPDRSAGTDASIPATPRHRHSAGAPSLPAGGLRRRRPARSIDRAALAARSPACTPRSPRRRRRRLLPGGRDHGGDPDCLASCGTRRGPWERPRHHTSPPARQRTWPVGD
jgi:hypothetical protein